MREATACRVPHPILSPLGNQAGACSAAAWRPGMKPWQGQRGRLAEVEIPALADKAVVASDRLLEIGGRHGDALIFHHDLLGELADRVGLEEEAALDVDVRRLGLPLLALDRRGIEDRPDR